MPSFNPLKFFSDRRKQQEESAERDRLDRACEEVRLVLNRHDFAFGQHVGSPAFFQALKRQWQAPEGSAEIAALVTEARWNVLQGVQDQLDKHAMHRRPVRNHHNEEACRNAQAYEQCVAILMGRLQPCLIDQGPPQEANDGLAAIERLLRTRTGQSPEGLTRETLFEILQKSELTLADRTTWSGWVREGLSFRPAFERMRELPMARALAPRAPSRRGG